MSYYDNPLGTSYRWDEAWVKVLPVPNRYPQDRELIEVQQTALSHLKVHSDSYKIIKGLRATLIGNRLSLSKGIIWCSIGDDYYINVPSTQVVLPQGATRLGIELVKESVGSGYDPILGGIQPLLWEVPLDRVHVYARYVWDTLDSLPVLTIEGNKIHYYSDKANTIRDNLIKTYMREIDGDYIAAGVAITHEGGLPSRPEEGWVHIGAGKAWIAGSPIELQAQSIPYSEGVLQLCSDGTVVIEPSYRNYIPEYSAIVSSTNSPILIGNQYGVVLPFISKSPYLTPHVCMPLALLQDNTVVDIAARLPTQEELAILLYNPQVSIAGNQTVVGDINHPLYRARVYSNGGSYIISLPRVVETVVVPNYIPPHTRAVLEESTIRTDWIDSTPNPSTPPPPPPFVYSKGPRVQAYNLTPGGTYIPNPAPLTVTRGTLTGLSIVADDKGMLEYQSTAPLQDLSGIQPSNSPSLSIGLGQSFQVLSPTMLGAVSIYLRAGYYGVISICQLLSGQPYGPALAWAGVSSTSTGWLDVAIGPVFLLPGTYALISQSIVGSVLGRRHYLLPILEGTPETTGSLNMMLSQSSLTLRENGVWESLPSMDLLYKVHKAIPTATYRDRSTVVEWGEAFDGYEYRPSYLLPTGTYITCTTRVTTSVGVGPLVGNTFPPMTSLTITEALFGTDTLFPVIQEGEIDLHITSKTGTWISKEELVGPYTGVEVSLNANIPEGSTVTVYISMGNGWSQIDLVDVIGGRYIYRVEELSPTSSSTDINGVVKQIIRERLRIRIDLNTISPELRPSVWDISKVML